MCWFPLSLVTQSEYWCLSVLCQLAQFSPSAWIFIYVHILIFSTDEINALYTIVANNNVGGSMISVTHAVCSCSGTGHHSNVWTTFFKCAFTLNLTEIVAQLHESWTWAVQGMSCISCHRLKDKWPLWIIPRDLHEMYGFLFHRALSQTLIL